MTGGTRKPRVRLVDDHEYGESVLVSRCDDLGIARGLALDESGQRPIRLVRDGFFRIMPSQSGEFSYADGSGRGATHGFLFSIETTEVSS